jgi:hypothetical protein
MGGKVPIIRFHPVAQSIFTVPRQQWDSCGKTKISGVERHGLVAGTAASRRSRLTRHIVTTEFPNKVLAAADSIGSIGSLPTDTAWSSKAPHPCSAA